MQKAAIEEQEQNARENPIAAAAVAAAVSGTLPQSNAENLLDIDFDGAAPASSQKQPLSDASGLDGLAGTPQRVASPAVSTSGAASNMDDLMGVFGNGSATAPNAVQNDLMNGFASLDLAGGPKEPPPPQEQLGKKAGNNEDLLGMF